VPFSRELAGFLAIVPRYPPTFHSLDLAPQVAAVEVIVDFFQPGFDQDTVYLLLIHPMRPDAQNEMPGFPEAVIPGGGQIVFKIERIQLEAGSFLLAECKLLKRLGAGFAKLMIDRDIYLFSLLPLLLFKMAVGMILFRIDPVEDALVKLAISRFRHVFTQGERPLESPLDGWVQRFEAELVIYFVQPVDFTS